MKVRITATAIVDVSNSDCEQLKQASSRNLASAIVGAKEVDADLELVDDHGDDTDGPGQALKGLVNRCIGRG